MPIDTPSTLLGGLSPARFMQRHWQKRPLLVRQAWPGVRAPLERAELFSMVGREDLESRLVVHRDDGWRLRPGPLPRRALPPIRRPGWTLLVQGLDLHVPAARQMLSAFDFVPHARLDDLMLSWASDGGGVGPHLDSYDVFLLQVQGRRRWRIGRARDTTLVDGVPLKILRHFAPEEEWVLDPGDMLYLPPRWAHDGQAVGECMTASIGFRAPTQDAMAREVMARWLDDDDDDASAGGDRRYADPRQAATPSPGRVPPAMADFARDALRRRLERPWAVERAIGEVLSEPKPQVWFEAGSAAAVDAGLRLDGRSRMLYDDRCLYLNGESWRVAGRDATVLRRLADRREIDAADVARLSTGAREIVAEWLAAGWLHERTP